MKLATAQQTRELDARAIEERKIPSIDLMERAAEHIRDVALEEISPRKPGTCRAAVFCGSGNNGGDGIAAARLLFLAGVRVRVFLAGKYEKLTKDAMEMTGRLSDCGIDLEPFDPDSADQRSWAKRSDLVIDALFGVGLSREISPDSTFGAAVALMNEAQGTVIAADLPSGVDANTGKLLGLAVKADRTVTFTLPKIGQFAGDGAVASGKVSVCEIGIPKDLVREVCCPAQTVGAEFVRSALPARKADGHKGDFGKLLIVGGSVGYTGAPYLCAYAAERSGCGLVYLGVPESIWAVEAQKCVGAMPFPLADKKGLLSYKALHKIEEKLEKCDVLALGPGLGKSEEITRLVCELLRRTQKPMVLDADGINALSGHIDILDARRGRVTILTPHDGEFVRLGGDLSEGDRIKAARAFAVQHGCTLVLKGHRTITATPEGNALVNTTGNLGLAKGGSGDVLTGMIASLLCQGATSVQACAAGVWLHGKAGDLAAEHLTEYAMTPQDTAAMLPLAFASIRDLK
ncbi:MAG: NAD(P)H-hydrate dehydratase [Oscillibacter sp.]|jgi:NAD(P)H-hydrate epimerase|nr:NAD(P)H-hydrate dehydratase [Oscillibacter sp.]